VQGGVQGGRATPCETAAASGRGIMRSMRPLYDHTRHAVAALCALCLVLTATLGPASATASAATLAEKMAQAAAAETKLGALRAQLTQQLAESDQVETELDAARAALLDTASKLAALDSEVEADQRRLDDRAVAMYKSDGFDYLEVLLGTRSLQDFAERMTLIEYIQSNDTRLLNDVTARRSEGLVLKQSQESRQEQLVALRQEADARKAQVEASVAQQEQLTESLAADVATLVAQQEAAAAAAAAAAASSGSEYPAPPVPFNPNTVISDAAYLDAGSMSADTIQAFLNNLTGSLKSYSAPDHNGNTRTAAQMIAEASVAYGVSPKVILVTLQKEQSLLTQPVSAPSSRLDWAMGCGKTDSVTYQQYKGFGNQIWGGAQKLISNRSYWRPGISLSIDGTAVYPTNASTHAQYRYTPHFGGVTSFWRIYWRYFGDPVR
jgi:peptidoglycan hydrolase CwlO-like protein